MNLECSLKCAARGSLQIQDAKNCHFDTIAQLCRAISLESRHVSTIRKKLVKNSNTSSTCPDNIVHFGLLTAEICWRVWGTPANFNGFRVLPALLHGSGRQPNFEAFNRGSHLYSAGRPSRWAMAHILVPIISIKNKAAYNNKSKDLLLLGYATTMS